MKENWIRNYHEYVSLTTFISSIFNRAVIGEYLNYIYQLC